MVGRLRRAKSRAMERSDSVTESVGQVIGPANEGAEGRKGYLVQYCTTVRVRLVTERESEREREKI